MTRKRIGVIFILLLFFVFCHLFSEELPLPNYDNSLIFSFTYSLLSDSADTEVPHLKDQFGGGLYAWLACSSFVGVAMDWHTDITNADNEIENFKDKVDALVEKAETYGVGLQITLNYGISRLPQYYNSAKDEDIRNAQWYNDNNIAAESQLNGTQQLQQQQSLWHSPVNGWYFNLNKIDGYRDDQAMPGTAYTNNANEYSLTTMSRYARKLRNHLEAKVTAALDYLTQVQQQHPGLLLVVSAPGEAEMNLHPVNNFPYLQEYFCDYSPFAALEFRDWVKHEGLYAPDEKYAGEGYWNGGSRYQGANGLQYFNQDFGTSFTTWELKYYHWNLSDPLDTNYTDNNNPDPNLLPVDNYTFGVLMPNSGPNFISGGFDPPRVMRQKGEDAFWDLWQVFRETMVYHYVKDMAAIARQSGFPKDHYYTHQIPADYLFGTRPNDPAIPYLNPRYYSSASPLWTADAYSDTGMGVTMYDINFGTWYARTTEYILPVISSMSDNWGAMEYNPEIVPISLNVEMAPAQSIYQQIMRLYDHNVHFIGFFKWIGNTQHQFKGTNREDAAKLFFDAIKDKARQPVDTVLTPKTIEGFTGNYQPAPRAAVLAWSQYIWNGLSYQWEDWGDFKEFVLYRGYSENFLCSTASEIARTTGYSFQDPGFGSAEMVYYKIAAVNIANERGNTVTVGVVTGGNGGTPILDISKNRINFGATTTGSVTPQQTFLVGNTGSGVLNWSAVYDADWLDVSPGSGINSGMVNVSARAAEKTPGTYYGTITISAPNAGGSPQTVQVTLAVYAPGQDSAPFGSFETPVHQSTVRSSVPFTGWVLDDIAVESVKIYRQDGTNLVYIGNAMLVEGARPDIETAYHNYPNNSCAGWGYMMLTNFLPNGGNGTFVFHAIATDTTGHQVTLGTKTVTCDNASAEKPFGAMDTPAPGGTASGSSYRNHGWVLTPMPNCIPTSGATIDVYVDGVNLGHPVYNNYRSDIASLFPGYCNSNGAHAYFDIDTTAFTPGIHTIAWIATDDAGNSDGIGSRYFNVQNTAGSREQGANWQGAWSMEHGVSPEGIKNVSREPVEIVKGFKKDVESQTIYPDLNGNIKIEINELERLEMHLDNSRHSSFIIHHSSFYRGYHVVNHQLRPLPIGSTLDAKRGIFCWQPGPGFTGEFQFVFFIKQKNREFARQNITVKIKYYKY